MAKENLTIHNIFSKTVSKFPNKVALQIKKDDQWERIAYRDLENSSHRIATFLIQEGLKKGDYVSIILENRPEWAMIYLGIMYAGLACVPLDTQLSPEDLKNLIIDSATKLIFCSYDVFSQKIEGDIQEYLAKIVVLDRLVSKSQSVVTFSDIEDIVPEPTLFPSVLPQDIASLIYTSGTTGNPKGVLLTHKNICSNFTSIDKLDVCFASDNILSILPLYHTYAFMVTLIVPLFLGARVTYFGLSFKPQDIGLIIKEAEISVLVGVPQLFSLLHKAIFNQLKNIPFFLIPLLLPIIKRKVHSKLGRSLRLLASGGARLQPKLSYDLYRLLGVKLIEGYGLTETSPVVTLNPPQKIKFGSVGKPIPDVRIKISEPDKSGIGEVLIQGPNVMPGYFKQPDLTSQVIKEGWFYSGDLGYLDKDGYLFLVGRAKEVIVLSSGKNIYPEELEEYYSRSPYIKELCILSKSEEKFGRPIESLYAVVVANLEYFRQTNQADIRGKIRWELENMAKNLPTYMHIMGFTVTKEELPRTVLKKIKRYQVRQRYLEKLPKIDIKENVFSQEDMEILKYDTAQKIISYISTQLNKPVYLDSHLEIDLGIDSLTRVELGLGLEELLSIKIPDEVIYKVSTVKEVIITILDIIAQARPPIDITKESPKTWAQILSQTPKEEILKKIRIDIRFLDKLLTFIFKNMLLFMFRIFWRLEIKGREFLPPEGPYVFCSNHASYLDGFAIFSSISIDCAMNIFFLGYSEIFEHPSVNWAIKTARLIPIDPAMHLTQALESVSFVLRHRKIVCIFPEGRRSIDDNIGEFKKGIGILIKELDVPAVPVYIKGSHQTWPRGTRLPRFYPLKVIFGQPLFLQELIKRGRAEGVLDDYEAVAKGLRKEVLKLAVREGEI